MKKKESYFVCGRGATQRKHAPILKLHKKKNLGMFFFAQNILRKYLFFQNNGASDPNVGQVGRPQILRTFILLLDLRDFFRATIER